ncbi:hypothetical protein KP509_08G012500 [Ceratopteris richardii]|uniref:Uncharacterized protein n=1 Tax=Ceratopteris richardii TaxID=49495 RepID=A0A8T2UA24_CERRI|nr:hypothetical protein KP509_08G012500 [Ceratopteris richardii]
MPAFHFILKTSVVVSSIVLSAGTYLFDFGSNIVVLVEYSQRFAELSKREARGLSICDAKCRHQTSELAGYFYALLVILHSDAPLWAAYFLPLIHLYRLSKLLWRTLSCAGVHNLRSPEMNGLYSILGTAMEGVPMLILQFCAYLVLVREGILLKSMVSTFKVSVGASLLSAAYNGGTSVESIAKNAITIKQRIGAGIIGGGFTLSAALTRCLTFANVIVHIREYFSQKRTEREQAKFHASDTLPLLIIGGSIITYTIHFWLLQSPRELKKNVRNIRRLLTSLAFGYVSMILGPLYPTLSFAADNNQLGCYVFRLKVFMICILHILLDVAVLCATHILGTLPIGYLITSVLAMVGFLAFLMCYLILDAYCGPTLSSIGIRDAPPKGLPAW